jgi:thymidylate kinase
MSQSIIVFEGPDGCGKTNMAKALSNKTGVPYFKNKDEWKHFKGDTTYFVNALTYGDPYFLSYLEQTQASVIVDRWYPSEWVYAQVFDRPTNYDVLQAIDNHAASIGTKIIIPVRSNYSNVVDQFADIVTPSMLEKIHNQYMEFQSWTRCQTFSLNVDDEDLDRELTEILDFIGK